ncbi:MAG: response regulator [Paenibacillaceae bacterium]|jgi:two-component system response regulator YesN|nr:response regulator [Paenibacillaceae bacterium]
MKGGLLIVDDEPLIRKGLVKLVENNSLGWSVIGEAGNGREAIAKLEELRPDLVMTDIRMPLMDGLELANYITSNFPETSVIVLTGYRDFEYAQKAIAYGVKQFLIKPCPEEEVCQILRLAYEQYRQLAAAKEREASQLRDKEDQQLRAILLRLPYDVEEARRLEQVLAGCELWLLQVNSYYPEERQYRREDLKLLQFAIGNILQELLAARPGNSRWLTLESDCFVFFLPNEGDNEPLFTQAAAVVHKLLGIVLTANCLGVPTSLNQMEIWIEGHLKTREEHDSAAAGDSREFSVNENNVKLIRNELAELLLLGRPAELHDYLLGIRQSVRQPSISLQEAKIGAFCAAMGILDVRRKELKAEPIGDIGKQVAELNLAHSKPEVERWLDGQIHAFEEALSNWQNQRTSGIINRAVLYIEEHYTEECSIADVAAHFHLSPNHFGNLFKRETGESFSGYVARLRMNKAKFLLRNTDLKVTEIAQGVGYLDSNYFATVFRQTVGLSPTEYRKQ